MTAQRNRTVRSPDHPSGRMTLARSTSPTTATRSSLRFREQPADHDDHEDSDTVRTEPTRGQTQHGLQDVIGTLEQAAPTTDTQAHRSAPAPRRPSLPAPLDRPARLTDLSATVCQIRGLQQIHADDAALQDRLRRTATELESLISHLLRADGAGSRPDTPPPSSTPRQRAAEHAFLTWLAQPTSTDELTLVDGDEPEPMAWILGELSLSRRLLPAETAAGLRLPAGTTIGHAAAEVLLAVKDPAGPRCRSFRAAVFYLRDLDHDHLAWQGDGQVDR